MRLRTKLIIILLSVVLLMICLPVLLIKLNHADISLGFTFILFFAICPLLEISLGIISGTDLKKLFMVPTLTAIVLPFSYAMAIEKMVWELFVYSILYAVCGTLVMITTHLYLKHKKEKKDERNE